MTVSTHVTIPTDIIKFFQAFIRHMAKIGGVNLPKTISTSMGAELAKTYARNNLTDWKLAITNMFTGMGGKLEIVEKEQALVLRTQYPQNFCPIGGENGKERFDVTAEAICKPYVTGFLKAAKGKLEQPVKITKCILREGGTTCEFEVVFAK